jgi:hypothetical protein
MGTSIASPPAPVGTAVSIFKTSSDEFVVSGDEALLRDFFEAHPEQWLRCLALTKDKNG